MNNEGIFFLSLSQSLPVLVCLVSVSQKSCTIINNFQFLPRRTMRTETETPKSMNKSIHLLDEREVTKCPRQIDLEEVQYVSVFERSLFHAHLFLWFETQGTSWQECGGKFFTSLCLSRGTGNKRKGQHQCMFFQGTPSVTYFLLTDSTS